MKTTPFLFVALSSLAALGAQAQYAATSQLTAIHSDRLVREGSAAYTLQQEEIKGDYAIVIKDPKVKPNEAHLLELLGPNGETVLEAVGNLQQVNLKLNQWVPTLGTGIYWLRISNVEQNQYLQLLREVE